ncbi:MAG TPA: hypothetical protein VF601_03355 [Beijerinckiaceae bacterium]|jgi:hypothetical protein
MRAGLPACLAAAFAGAGWLVVAPSALDFGAAEAKDYYTRKRVNGVWITGRFQKRQAGAAQPSRAAQPPSSSPEHRAARPPARFPASSLATPAAPDVAAMRPPAGDEGLLKLKAALEARASELAATAGSGAASAATGGAPSEGAPAEPRSVSFDFEARTRTTVFTNGLTVTESFDVAGIRPFASRPPGAAPERPAGKP